MAIAYCRECDHAIDMDYSSDHMFDGDLCMGCVENMDLKELKEFAHLVKDTPSELDYVLDCIECEAIHISKAKRASVLETSINNGLEVEVLISGPSRESVNAARNLYLAQYSPDGPLKTRIEDRLGYENQEGVETWSRSGVRFSKA